MKKFTESVSTSNKIKIGLDQHGVIDCMPEFFAFFTKAIIDADGEIHIITGGENDDCIEYLNANNIKFTHFFSVYDHLIKSGAETVGEIQFPNRKIQKKFKNDVWDKAKADYCLENNISLHLDDTLIYNDYFKTPFARLWSHTGTPKAPHKDLRHLD